MRSLAATLDGLSSPRPADEPDWYCSACREPQVSLGDALPPPDALCFDCRRLRREPGLRQRLTAAGVPQEFLAAAERGRDGWIAHFRRSGPWSDLAEWRGDPAQVLFYGPTGTGKTAAATVLLAEWLERGGTGRWMRSQRALERLRQEFDYTERRLMAELSQAQLLVLDDLFPVEVADRDRGVTRFELERMLELVAGRYDDRRSTVVTTMRTPEELVRLLPPLASRLVDGGMTWLFDAADSRMERR